LFNVKKGLDLVDVSKKSLQAPNIRYFKIRVDRLFVSLVSTGYKRYTQTACFKKGIF